MGIWKQPISLEAIQERSANTMVENCGIVFTEIGDDFLKATMPVNEKTQQPIHIMHGGASCVLAESVGSLAANFAVDKSFYCVGLSINTSHIKQAPVGTNVAATARPLHLGRSTHVWHILVHNESDALVSSTQLTMMVLKTPSD